MKGKNIHIKILAAIGLTAFAALMFYFAFSSSVLKTFYPKQQQSALSETVQPVSETASEAQESKAAGETPSEGDTAFPININTADAALLLKIPGIGEVKANEIVAYREANGNFSSVDDLVNVYGIGESTLEKIKPYICV